MFGSELPSTARLRFRLATMAECAGRRRHCSLSELEVCQEIYDVFIHSMGHSRVSLLESYQAIHQHAHTDTPVIGRTIEINFRVPCKILEIQLNSNIIKFPNLLLFTEA